MSPLAIALARLNPNLDDLLDWLGHAGEPHTYNEIPGIHDHDCEACVVRHALVAVREGRAERERRTWERMSSRSVAADLEAEDG